MVKKNFVFDDEKYFTLSATQMPGNDVYYTNEQSVNLNLKNFELNLNRGFQNHISIRLGFQLNIIFAKINE